MRIRVEGGHPLNGVYTPSGSTNAALHALAAALMTDEPVTLSNVPHTASTDLMLNFAGLLGAEIKIAVTPAAENTTGRTVTLHTPQIVRRHLTTQETQGFIGSLLCLAPILARRGFARLEIDFPLNRIRTHLDALRDLGQDVSITEGAIELRSARWDYKDIILTQASVTATSLIMLLASVLGQETIIHNAACEPHIQGLADMLEIMGVQVEGVGSNVLHIWGIQPTQRLHGAELTLGSDYIETASVAAIAALSGGRIQITPTRRTDLRMISRIYHRLGMMLDVDEHSVFVPRHETLLVSSREEDVDSYIETAPWPGFPSDLIGIATLIATQARGTTMIHEKMFNDRLLFIDKLNRMGAQIVLCDPHRAIVIGPSPLLPIYMDTPDVRIGLGMLGAALLASGESVIDNAQAINRSFEGVIEKLQALGAKITVE